MYYRGKSIAEGYGVRKRMPPQESQVAAKESIPPRMKNSENIEYI
jgi:hypothetical protein